MKAGNQIGGQWAPQMRAGGVAPPIGDGPSLLGELDQIIEQRRLQFDRIATLQSKFEDERVALATELLSGYVEKLIGTHDEGSEIQRIVFEFSDDDHDDQMGFGCLQRSDGEFVELSDDARQRMCDYVDELGFYEHSTPYEYRYPGHKLEPFITLVEPSLPSSDARPVGEYVNILDEASFNRALLDASNDGRIVGTVRTRSQFEEELRSHLAASANEMKAGDRDTFFDDGNIDAWVGEAVERYELSCPDEDTDSRAFRDAIDAANPYEH